MLVFFSIGLGETLDLPRCRNEFKSTTSFVLRFNLVGDRSGVVCNARVTHRYVYIEALRAARASLSSCRFSGSNERSIALQFVYQILTVLGIKNLQLRYLDECSRFENYHNMI